MQQRSPIVLRGHQQKTMSLTSSHPGEILHTSTHIPAVCLYMLTSTMWIFEISDQIE